MRLQRGNLFPRKKAFRDLLIMLVLLVPAVAPAVAIDTLQVRSPDPVLEPWRWTVFPELKGLGLWCMAEDRDGHMWFGVDEGVRVYDGVNG